MSRREEPRAGGGLRRPSEPAGGRPLRRSERGRPFVLALALLTLAASDGSSRAARAEGPPTAIERVRAVIAADPELGRLPYDAVLASPFLLCRQRESAIDEAAIAKMAESERAAASAAFEARRAHAARELAEKARVFTQVYERFLATFGARCGLKRLDASSTAGAGATSPAADGALRLPLVVWTFTDAQVFTAYHDTHMSEGVAPDVSAYVSRATGWSFRVEARGTDRESELHACARLATLALLDAFARQRSTEPSVAPLPAFFEAGLASWFGAISMAKDRTVSFPGIDRPRLANAKRIREEMSKANRRMPVFPLREFTRFTAYADPQRFGADAWKVSPGFALGLFLIQSSEFFRFLDDADGGARRSAIGDLLDAWLGRPRVIGSDATGVVARALRIDPHAPFAALEKEFAAYRDQLLRIDLDSLPAPPSLEDWPGYLPPTLEPSK